VSPEEVITCIHPDGGVQEAGGPEIVVGKRDAISVGVGEAGVAVGVGDVVSVSVWIVAVGDGRLSGRVGGIRVGVAGAGNASARER
jgi:hypothetical protein